VKKVEEREYFIDEIGRKIMAIQDIEGFPQADNQGHDPGLYDPASSHYLAVKPLESKTVEKV
jgi:hypothetical protein